MLEDAKVERLLQWLDAPSDCVPAGDMEPTNEVCLQTTRRSVHLTRDSRMSTRSSQVPYLAVNLKLLDSCHGRLPGIRSERIRQCRGRSGRLTVV